MRERESPTAILGVPPVFEPFQGADKPFLLSRTEDYLAIFKPAGMHSVGAPRRIALGEDAEKPMDLVSWLKFELSDHAKSFERDANKGDNLGESLTNLSSLAFGPRISGELGTLSRLDRDTSGLILIARSVAAMRRAIESQKSGKIRKYYRIVCAPSQRLLPGFRPPRRALSAEETSRFMGSGAVSEGLAIESYFRSYGKRGATVACVSSEEKAAEKKRLSASSFLTLVTRRGKVMAEEFEASAEASEIEALIYSGFRHQIRAHMAWIGYPIAGDRLYGGVAASRLYLECHRVEVDLPGKTPHIFELYGNESRGGGVAWK